MKKMNKNYEAPVAEVFEMNMPTVLMASGPTSDDNTTWEDPAGGFEG
jgi:hypothetical protein